MLATSRRTLRLSAEQVVEVRPLDARRRVELLASRVARRRRRRSALERAVARASSCERLEGLPLAIELAAPWFRSARRGRARCDLLDSRLDVLERRAARRARAAADDARRRSTGASSCSTPGASACSAASRCSRAASTTRGGRSPSAGRDAALDQLAELVDASIVQSRDGRHRLLEVVREYASALPSADDEGRELHARHFLALAERSRGRAGRARAGALARAARAQHDDLRAALDWLRRRGDASLELRLAAALGRFWYIRGYLSEGLERLQRAAARDAEGDDPDARERAPLRVGARRASRRLRRSRERSSSGRSRSTASSATRRGRPRPQQPRRDPARASASSTRRRRRWTSASRRARRSASAGSSRSRATTAATSRSRRATSRSPRTVRAEPRAASRSRRRRERRSLALQPRRRRDRAGTDDDARSLLVEASSSRPRRRPGRRRLVPDRARRASRPRTARPTTQRRARVHDTRCSSGSARR